MADGSYAYMGQGAGPRIVVIQDLDDIRGYGSFWGEVNSNLHKGLGALGVITDGSVRDLPDLAENFQVLAGSILPSHAYVHVVDFGGEVSVGHAGARWRPTRHTHRSIRSRLVAGKQTGRRIKRRTAPAL